jgi:hypothetical protein
MSSLRKNFLGTPGTLTWIEWVLMLLHACLLVAICSAYSSGVSTPIGTQKQTGFAFDQKPGVLGRGFDIHTYKMKFDHAKSICDHLDNCRAFSLHYPASEGGLYHLHTPVWVYFKFSVDPPAFNPMPGGILTGTSTRPNIEVEQWHTYFKEGKTDMSADAFPYRHEYGYLGPGWELHTAEGMKMPVFTAEAICHGDPGCKGFVVGAFENNPSKERAKDGGIKFGTVYFKTRVDFHPASPQELQQPAYPWVSVGGYGCVWGGHTLVWVGIGVYVSAASVCCAVCLAHLVDSVDA